MAEDDKEKSPGADAPPEKPPEKPATDKPAAEKPAKEAPPRPAPPKNPIEDDVRARFGDAVEVKYGFLDLEIHVKPEKLLEICDFLKNHPSRPHTFLRNLTAVDWKDAGQIEVVYHLAPLPDTTSVCVKCRAPRDAASVPSVTGLWPSAEWLEREVYDLFGVGFENHPDLRRIMLTPEWEGHPLRRDYAHKEPALPWIPKGLEQKS